MSNLCGCCYFITIFRTHLELFEVLSLSDLMYKYFCKLSLGLKFGEFYFGFTGYSMPMIKASQNTEQSPSFSVGYFSQTSFSPLAKTIDHTVQSAEYQLLQIQSLILYTIRTAKHSNYSFA